MAFKAIGQGTQVGADLTRVDDSKMYPLGTRIKGRDDTYGEGEFIYLQGVATVALGSVVRYNEAFLADLLAATERGPVAVALAAVVASKYGWFQIAGMATVKAATVVADAPCFTSATPGTLDDASVVLEGITNAVFQTADGTPSAGLAIASIQYPYACGSLGAVS